MNELSRHIEILLLEHNCVIVPDLGGFIAQDVPARYVAEENIFLPPFRTVVFNPQLTLNDGLLVQSYMKIYNTNYPETVKLIEQQVSNLKTDIQEKGTFELNGIGILTANIDGTLVFEPNEAGIVAPNLYGLDAVTVHKQEKKSRSSARNNSTDHRKATNTKNYTIMINKELVNYIVAAVISVFFYFLWATPLTDSSSLNPQQASALFPHNVHVQHINEEILKCRPTDSVSLISRTEFSKEETAEEIAEKQLDLSNQEKTIVDESVFDADSEIEKEKASQEKDLTQSISKEEQPFTIVLASRIPLKNAEVFAEQVRNEGYSDISVFKKRSIVRVVLGNYASEKEAYIELHQLRKQSALFKEAWILEK